MRSRYNGTSEDLLLGPARGGQQVCLSVPSKQATLPEVHLFVLDPLYVIFTRHNVRLIQQRSIRDPQHQRLGLE